MPIKTAKNIVWRYNSTGVSEPRKRGPRTCIFEKRIIARFVLDFLSNPAHSNSTLNEIQTEIFRHKQELQISDSVPSISWIEDLLKSKLFHSKPITLKYASIEPKIRNADDVIEQRFQYVSWLQSLSIEQAQTLIFLDEHGYNLFTIKHRARSIQGERASIIAPTVKGTNVTVTLAVSPVFGKLTIQILPYATTAQTFNLETFMMFGVSVKKFQNILKYFHQLYLLIT